MEKAIKLVMCEDKNIKILLNEQEKHIIEAQNRTIDASKIYEIIGYTLEDHYTVSSENKKGLDDQVLMFFVEILTNITEKINKLSINN